MKFRRHFVDRPISAKQAKRRLGILLGLFFTALALPTALLVSRVYAQLENETYFRYRNQAEDTVRLIDQRIQDILAVEEKRSFAEYSFFNVLQSPLLKSKGLQLSPLSEIPPKTGVSGVVGFFQIDPDGSFHSPALPEIAPRIVDKAHALSQTDLQKRTALRDRLRNLVNTPTSADASQAVSSGALPARPEGERVLVNSK